MSCSVGRKCGSDLVLLWLSHRLAAAVPIQPLAWELPYAAGAALKRKKKKSKQKNPRQSSENGLEGAGWAAGREEDRQSVPTPLTRKEARLRR